MAKEQVCVIFGGQSPEHEISRRSVTSVIENLDKAKYDIHMIGITKDGEWFLYTGDYKNIMNGEWESDSQNKKKAVISPDAKDRAILVFDGDSISKLHIDVIFPVLHGEYGEDGTVQGLFELSHIPYVGMGVMASANGMDKTSSKLVFQNADIPQADWYVYNKGEDITYAMNVIERSLGYPCFVKPARTGSSVGVGKAHNREELKSAIENAAKYDRKVLIEENIDGHEIECSVLGNGKDVSASVVGEIVPAVEFYDFDAKYKDDATVLVIPAEIDKAISEKIREYAIRAFKALDGQGLSRVDFFVRKSDNAVILNEVNTMPGFTSISMYPKLWVAAGLEYGELLDKLIQLAKERVK